jgi:hypothetical protein
MSLLSLESPDLTTFIQRLGIDVLFHPSLTNPTLVQRKEMLEAIL